MTFNWGIHEKENLHWSFTILRIGFVVGCGQRGEVGARTANQQGGGGVAGEVD